MSKLIKPTSDAVESIITKFTEWIRGAKNCTEKMRYEFDLGKTDTRATLLFTAAAYMKMKYLIAVYDTEAAWHGVVHRVNEGESTFVVSDILVYPQEVSGATVNTDQKQYQDWLFNLDDEVFNNLKFQGHSHVNMGVTPSSVDLEHQAAILEQVEDDMFYIFVIWNKKGDRTIKIYDRALNTLYDTEDVDVKILTDNDSEQFFKLMKDANEMIVKKSYTYGGSYYGSGYSGTGGYSSPTKTTNTTAAASAPAKKEETKIVKVSTGAQAVKAAADKVSPKDESKKGKRADGVSRSDYYWDDYECGY